MEIRSQHQNDDNHWHYRQRSDNPDRYFMTCWWNLGKIYFFNRGYPVFRLRQSFTSTLVHRNGQRWAKQVGWHDRVFKFLSKFFHAFIRLICCCFCFKNCLWYRCFTRQHTWAKAMPSLCPTFFDYGCCIRTRRRWVHTECCWKCKACTNYIQSK